MVGLLLADVPPPPPDLPFTAIPTPHPVAVAIAGCCLGAALWVLGRNLATSRGPANWTTPVVVAVFMLTLLATIWTSITWTQYSRSRRNYRGPGPVRQQIPDLENPLEREVLIPGNE